MDMADMNEKAPFESGVAPFIKVENLKYRYPHANDLALNGVSFAVSQGEFIGIVGANKAGKSTLTQALVGLVPQFYKGAYGGKVIVDGKNADTTPIAELCKTVGLVFQNPFNQLSGAKDTVYEEIAYGLQNMGVAPDEMKRRIDEVMALLDISQYGSRNPFDLSGGQMQRVAIASILVMEPEALVLDEPTSQLDPAGTEEVFKAVLKLAKAGKTIIMVEQKMELLAAYCDKILLMKKGEAVAFDSPGTIFARDDLSELGVQAPVYTRLAREQEWCFFEEEKKRYPVTAEEMEPFREQLGELVERISAQRMDRSNRTVINAVDGNSAGIGKTVFDIKNLQFSYGKSGNDKTDAIQKIISDLNVSLDGRTTAIIGQNGAGKTTLVKLLKGLLKPISGTVYYHKNDISGMTVAALAGEVGYIFQNPDDQIFKSRVLDEVLFGPLNIGMDKTMAEQKAKEALAMAGLQEAAEMNPYDLELAERKMVAIASVIAMDTKVVIFDEPTIAQDYAGRETIKQIIRVLAQQGKLVIAILHDMDFVAECFERVIAMAHGKILADGTAEEIFANERVLKEARLELPHVLKMCRECHIDSKIFFEVSSITS